MNNSHIRYLQIAMYGALLASLVVYSCDDARDGSTPLSARTTELAAGAVGHPYAAQLQAAGGWLPYSWTLEDGEVPPGLALNEWGFISGTAASAGTFDAVFQVRDSKGNTTSVSLSARINDETTPTIITMGLPEGAVEQPYAARLAAVNGAPPFVWSLEGGALPGGLTLSDEGEISGTPEGFGEASFTALVRDAEGRTATATLRIDIDNLTAEGVRFISWGDTKNGRDVLAALSHQAAALEPLFTIYVGDLCDDGFTRDCTDAWRSALNADDANALYDVTFPVRGNHDAKNPDGWKAYHALETTAATIGASRYTAFEEDTTFSFDVGNARFLGVGVPGDASLIRPEQIEWIDRRLAEAEERGLVHAFVYFHGPIYCSGSHCSCEARSCRTDDNVRQLIEAFNRHPILSATFHGHEHTFAYVHVDASRIPEVTRPFEQFITGDAGAGPSGCDDARVDDCMDKHGFASVEVNGPRFTVSFYAQGVTAPHKSWTFTKGSTEE